LEKPADVLHSKDQRVVYILEDMVVKHLLWFLVLCATVHAQVPPHLEKPLADARTQSYQYWGYSAPPWVQFPVIIDPTIPKGNATTDFKFSITASSVDVVSMRLAKGSSIIDVVPHEMDHVVRASIVRRPIPRWLDEGCSTQFEAGNDWPATVANAQSARQWVDESVLDLMDYPKGHTGELYGFGHTAVQCLLRRNTPKTLIAFQVDKRPVAEKLPDYYGMTASEFIQVWRTEVVMPQYCDTNIKYVPYPAQYPLVNNKPLLEVWGANWCGPCVLFKKDYNEDANFRQLLNNHYHIHFRDFGNPFLTLEKTLKSIDKVPTFLIPSQRHRVVGYQTKEKLLAELGIKSAAPYVRQLPTIPPVLPSIPIPPIVTLPPPPTPIAPTPVSQSPPEAPRIAQDESDFQDDPKYVQPLPNASTGQPEASTGLLRWGFGKVWDNKALLLGGALLATGFGGGLGGYLIKGWATKKVGTIVAHIGDRGNNQPQQVPPTCATTPVPPPPYYPQPISQPTVVCPLGQQIAVQGQTPSQQEVGRNTTVPAPFPRKLDEARQLFALQGTEGRVAVLDAIRGMFLDAELEKALDSANTPEEKRMLLNLKNAIDSRVDEVAPLTTKV
jgi:thiol-disulfide isomerase/thioredoxin